MATALLILALVHQQDDFDKWIGQLGSDSIVDREEATRRLQGLGPAAIGKLEKALEVSSDGEVRSRITAIIVHIKRADEFAKVFGPTRRVTIAARGRPLKEIFRDLLAPGVSEVRAQDLDEEARIDVQIRQGTWWEALDRVAGAAQAKYRVEGIGDGQFKITFGPGKEKDAPVRYVEQFRISVIETSRIAMRSPAGNGSAAVAVVEVRHQPDLKPAGRTFEDTVRIESVVDAKGNDVKGERPAWAGSAHSEARPLALQEAVWIRLDAALPVTITGEGDLTFPRSTREISLDLSGDGSKIRLGKTQLSVRSFRESKTESVLKLAAETEEPSHLPDRLAGDSVVLIDSNGRRHSGSRQSTMSTGDTCEWEYVFTSGLESPSKAVVKWITEFHQVRIPFRLEGVRLPDLK